MKIAVTGGIGSGKSSVSRIIEELGFNVVYTDSITAELERRADVIEKIGGIFPSAVKDGSLDRRKLAAEAFASPDKLNRLNALLHPLVMEETFRRLSLEDVGFAEVPLLFESGYGDKFDKIIVVLRNRDERINSVMARSGLSRAEVKARVSRQIPYDKTDFTGYVTIVNDGAEAELESKVKTALLQLGIKV